MVESVARYRGTSVEDIPQLLSDIVDPDAVETLSTGGNGHVHFEYAEAAVTVDHFGVVAVEPLEGE